MLRVAVIADDLTGAADTGIQFCRPEAPTYLLGYDHISSFPFPESPHSLSLFTNTRNVNAEQAGNTVNRVASAIKNLNPEFIYKKIDSCLRGNIGAELDALAESMGFEVSFVSSALPAQGRTILHDIHYLRGVPLAETEMARDPVSPVTESRVSVLLGRQSRYKVARVDLDILEGRLEELVAYIRGLIRLGAKHLVFDASTQNHLDRIASLALAHFPKCLLVGSAGLASSLPRILFPGAEGTQSLPDPVGERILFVCGSASDVLRAQIEELLRSSACSSYTLDPLDLESSTGKRGIEELSRAAARDLVSGSVVLKIRPPGRSRSPANGQQILRGLTELALSVVNHVRPDGIFLSGGDTASAAWDALQAEAILLERELLPGFVLGTLCKGSLHGLPVVVKPGAFGASDALVRIYDMLTCGKDQSHGSKH